MQNVRTNTTVLQGAGCLGLAYALLLFGCASAPPQAAAPGDSRAAGEAAIRKADADWVAAAQTRKVEDWVAFYSDDAVVLPPNDKIADNKDAIRKAVGDLLGLPGVSVKWQATKVEVAQSGEIGYAYGRYQLSATDAKGHPITDQGKNLEIWKRQADGSWKCAVDTWSSDLPAPPQ